MAKSLVRNRHAVTKMYGLKSQLQAVSLRIAVRVHAVHFSLFRKQGRRLFFAGLQSSLFVTRWL